jgi:hypothetical protein
MDRGAHSVRIFSIAATAFMSLLVTGEHVMAQSPRAASPSPWDRVPYSPNVPTDDKKELGRLFDQYATIAGGWYLELRCHYFPWQYKAQFEWNVAQVNIALQKKADLKFLLSLRAAARRTADATPCSDKARNIIVSSLVMSGQLAAQLAGQTYSPDRGLVIYANKIVNLLAAQEVDDHCKKMTGAARTEFDSETQEVVKEFEQSVGKDTIDRLRKGAKDASAKFGGKCDGQIELMLKNAEVQARRLTAKRPQ